MKRKNDKKKINRNRNRVIIFWAYFLVSLVVIGAVVVTSLRVSYGKFDDKSLSARVEYNVDKVIDDIQYGRELKQQGMDVESTSQPQAENRKKIAKLEAQKAAYNVWNNNKKTKVNAVDGVETYLCVGIDDYDRNDTEQCHADLIMLLSVNKNTQKINIVTLSREAYVYIPGVGAKRLADAFYYGDRELLVKTIEENYDINIDGFFITDYSDYIRMIDFVGGVSLKVNEKMVPSINERISELIDSDMIPELAKTDKLEKKSGKVVLDGAQSLAYLRVYTNGDYARGMRVHSMVDSFLTKVNEKNIVSVVKDLYPRFATNLSYDDYWKLVLSMPEYSDFEIKHYSLPSKNNVASFKEEYENEFGSKVKKSVLLNDWNEVEKVVKKVTEAKEEKKLQKFISDMKNPIKLIVLIYLVLVVFTVLTILYLIFIHKRRIVYVDVDTGKHYRSKKKYRRGEVAHPYFYADVVPGLVNGLFADKAMTAEFESDVKMPMNQMKVYFRLKTEKNKRT